jgi:putative protein-disulfide isomerase
MTQLILIFLLGLTACSGQNNQSIMDNKQNNPLLCDPQAGVCEVPLSAASGQAAAVPAGPKPVRLVYFTDPICSSCWGIEPQLRRLKLEYGHCIEVEYHMGGLLPSWDVYNSGGISKPSDVSHHWDEVSAYYKMPIDGDVWLEDPLPSSYPPSIAFKSAEIQSHEKALVFLRKIREMVFLEKKNITRWEHLALAAVQSGLDSTRLKQDMEGAGKQAFMADLELGRQLGVRGFPSLLFSDSDGNRQVVYGVRPYEQFEQAVLKMFPAAVKQPYSKELEALLDIYPSLCIQELAVLADISYQSAENILLEKEKQGIVQRFRSKNGPLWKRK